MKRILLVILMIVFAMQTVFAKEYSLNFNGDKYNLLYSAKNKEFGGFINEYFKKGETYNIWSEMIAVHHFPNAYSPIDRIKDFKDYLGSMHVPSSLTFDDKKNTAMIDFILISEKHMPVVLEFNIFKYEKSKKCGSIAVQYVKRYSATNTMQIEQIKSDFEHSRKHLIKKVQKLNIPEVVDKEIDKCIDALKVKSETDNEIAQEKKAIEEKERKALEEQEINELSTKTDENTLSEQSIPEEVQKEAAENNIKVNDDVTSNKELVKKENIEENIQVDNSKIANDSSKNVSKDVKTSEEAIIPVNNINTQNDLKEENKAPVPQTKINATKNEQKVKQSENKKLKKSKKAKKEEAYSVSNTKNSYIAEPRTKKELKQEVKLNRIKYKQLEREAKQRIKTEKRIRIKNEKLAKKQAKIDAKNKKKAEKMEKIPYEFSNSNSELIAKPRTKKDLKKQNKILKKQAKQRAKDAKKRLSD